jgi:hypothetical protein
MGQASEERSDKADILRFAGVLAGVFTLALLIGNWRTLLVIVAILGSEHRPALLKDASWGEPASAARFQGRFHAGASERDLLAWLGKNRFAVNARERTAGRQVNSFPCVENIKINWSVDANRRLVRTNALVSQVACL